MLATLLHARWHPSTVHMVVERLCNSRVIHDAIYLRCCLCSVLKQVSGHVVALYLQRNEFGDAAAVALANSLRYLTDESDVLAEHIFV
jgi:hypothetical protein